MLKILVAAALLTVGGAGAARAGEINLVNQSSVEIQHLTVAPAGTESWREDELGDNPEEALATGDWQVIEQLLPGLYDVKLGDDGEGECIIPAVQVDTLRVDLVITDRLIAETCPEFGR